MTTFSTQLKKLRQERHLSQDELARDLFISRQAISKWENAEATPDLEHTVKLAELLQVSLDELILAKEPEVKIERVIEKDRAMNIWEFLVDYWWIIILVGGYLISQVRYFFD